MIFSSSCIHALLKHNAKPFGANPAILNEGLSVLSHADLLRQAETTVKSLNELGVGRNDRVAIVLPQSPELAVAFLSVAAGATAAPLNHHYKEDDFRFYLEDLQARALIVFKGDRSAARDAAASLEVPVLELIPDSDGSGRFALSGAPGRLESEGGFAEAGDVGLVLHTSGTTSRPKMVPLTQTNLCISARNIVETVKLQPSDICLNIMPLFHIHGLVACVLASLSGGGSTVCTGAFNPEKFFHWLELFKPSWYSAVPTMHQAILAQHGTKAITPLESSLRFIRSSSAALPPPVMAGLERVFSVPVIESYGMTEAAHQMASNPLPPLPRKPGSVGLAAGPEICILNEANEPLPRGQTGEISIRGSNVTPGYAHNPEANASAFTGGWFRTGDQGYFDGEGYLFITGRLKEMINRGGENIAPRDIDEALLTHPDVKQAVGFAVPHASLGEDVAAAVVLKPDSSVDEAGLRAHAMQHLSDFKVPSRIIIVDDIPKGPTGKLQRIGLADKLKDSLMVVYEAPRSETAKTICSTMEEVLGKSNIGLNDNFFALGGDSLRSTQVIGRLNEAFGLEMAVVELFRLPTPALLASLVKERLAEQEMESLENALSELTVEERERLLTGQEPKTEIE